MGKKMNRTGSRTNETVLNRAIILLLLVVSISSSVAFAHSVTMNFRFHITDKISDAPETDGTFIASSHNSTLAALAFAGSLLTHIGLDTSNDPYLFQVAQDESQNRFLLALTNGTRQKLESKPAGRIPATTFGDLALPAAISQGLAVQLQRDTLHLTGLLGQGQMLIKSLGKLRLPRVDLQIVG